MKNELALLKKENKLRTEFIPEEDRDMIRRMSQYMSSRRIGAFDVEVTRKELIGMALGAMQDGESLQTVIGKDEKEFCDDIIENSKKNTSKRSTINEYTTWNNVLWHCFNSVCITL